MNKFNEIIEYAISLEEEAMAFYEDMGSRTNKTETQKVFHDMFNMEKGHKHQLEQVLKNHQLRQGKQLVADPDLRLSDYMVSVDESKKEYSYQESLIIGMKRENAAMMLYQKLSEEMSDPELKEIFSFLAAEERKHKTYFETRLEDQM